MKVVKKHESVYELAELIKERDKYQAIADELTKKIRRIIYKYDRKK